MNALAVATGEQGLLEFFAFDASYVEKLRAGRCAYRGTLRELLQRADPSQATLALEFQGSNRRCQAGDLHARTDTVTREGGLRQPHRLGPFVNSVCNHVLFEHYRSQKRTEATIGDEGEATIAGREPSALRLLEAKDTERVVRQILNQLPERDRRLLQSVLLEERNKDEVCAEFGITREYLRVLLRRARQSFKSCYTSRLGVPVMVHRQRAGVSACVCSGRLCDS